MHVCACVCVCVCVFIYKPAMIAVSCGVRTRGFDIFGPATMRREKSASNQSDAVRVVPGLKSQCQNKGGDSGAAAVRRGGCMCNDIPDLRPVHTAGSRGVL